ncbi:MAG: class II aldolase/adducin family protein [Alphaproteobacteria bacterium]|nr:class II aldolase/adducin family protein [Alphaproteobacteria bacterium]
MADMNDLIADLVIANRILGREGVCDAFGHISVRHPDRSDRYLLSCSRAPELVAADDIMEFDLDGTAVDAASRRPYLERFIHGAVYEARPEVHSVVHNHATGVLPYSITATPLRPIQHTFARIGANIPVWDIHDRFGDTNLLVTNVEQGRDLAACLGDNVVVLMRGHGCTVTAPTIAEAVLTSIYLQVNAQLQMDAMALGDVTFLTPGEVAANSQRNQPKSGAERAWEYYKARARD